MAEAPHHIECSICLDYVNPEEDKLVNLMHCGHVFHKECITAWFDAGFDDRKPCPQCRKPATREDIQPIYLQTKRDEQSEEMKKELERVREQLRKEKQRKTNLADPMVESMVNLTAKMRLCEASTAQRAVFLPNSRHFLFEGCQGVEDSIVFSEYTGQRNWHHQRRPCWQPDLVVGSGLGRDTIHNSLMNTIFNQQMEVVRQAYDEKKDGRLECTVKFGSLYIIESPPGKSMLVRDFNYGIGIQHLKNNPKAVFTSFAPTETPSERIVSVLLKEGFRETKSEEVVVVNVEHSKHKPRIVFEVYLDENLKFRSLRKCDRSFVNIDIRRKVATKPDIRLAVKSVDEEFEQANLKNPEKLYARDNLVRWDNSPQKRLLIDRSSIGRVYYARRKVMRSFNLHATGYSSSTLEKVLAVKLIDTTSFEDPQFNGTFKRMKKQTEVYIRVNGQEDLYHACEEDDFLQKLLTFCNKFQ